MKIIICVLIILFPLGARAAPFLVCDPVAGVDYFKLDLDGSIFDKLRSEVQPDGSIRFDLISIASGDHIIKLAACSDTWGCGGWSVPFPFTKVLPSIPDGLTIMP